MRVVTAAEMRALDARTIAQGTPGRVLMERAGRGAAQVASGLLRGRRGGVVIVCGRGNNGGDGFVVARHLKARGRRVEVWLAAALTGVRGDAARMLAAWRRVGGRLHVLATPVDVERFAARCRGAALVVDALFGTGLNTAVVGRAAEVIEAMNAAGVPTLAIDVPSGLSADGGLPLGVAVRATATATFGFAKIGLCVSPGKEYAGQLTVVGIGLHEDPSPGTGLRTELLEERDVAALLPARPRTAHKGTFGHVLVVAGSRGKLGAALLAAEGAARGGAGLTTLAVPQTLQPMAEGRVPEIMTATLPDDGAGLATAPSAGTLPALLAGCSVVVCGPGLGQGEGPRALVAGLVRGVHQPLVLDADGLNAVAGSRLLQSRPAATVLTPHPGEMARLVGGSIAEVQADRLGTARRFATANGVVVVLKGAGTIVAGPDGQCALAPVGNPGLASGGSGDVLAGLIGALVAQGLSPFDAATCGVFVHGRSADRIAARRGERGMLARDVLAEIPAVFCLLQRAGGP